MERLAKWAFRHKAAVIVLVVLVLVMGTVSYLTLPKELMPSLDAPQITVTVMGQGYDAQTMVDQVAKPIEQAVSGVKGKTDVVSTTQDGYTSVSISFDSKTNMKDAKTDVQDAISGITLPDGLSKPYIMQLNTSMIPVADVALTFKNGITDANIDTVKNKLIPLYQGIAGVSDAQVYGENPTQVMVHLDTKKLAKLHLPLQSVMGVLQGRNLTAAVGESTIAGSESTIKVVGLINSLAELKSLDVAPNVKLGDVASVTAQRSTQSIMHVNGKDAILLIVQKTAGGNAVNIGKDVKSVTDQVNKTYGPTVHASVPYATANFVLDSVNSMMREILMGALFATVVILLFLRNVRMTLVTIVSIPLSLGLTLFLLSESGVTLNILTLGAVAVAVGRLVDDSIVVIENAYRRSQIEGVSPTLVIDATREVGTAITTSTLTTVAVFLPVGLVQGALQQVILPFALTVVYSLISSLLVALTVVPLMTTGMLRRQKIKTHHRPERYMNGLRWLLNHKWLPLTGAVVVFVASLAAYGAMPKAEIDTADSTAVSVNLTYPATASDSTVKAGAERLEQFIMAQPQTQDSLLMIGNSESDAKYAGMKPRTQAVFNVVMKTNANADAFVKSINGQKSNYANATLDAFAAQGWGSSNLVKVDLTGDNTSALMKAANQVVGAVQGIAGVQKVSTNEQDVKPTYEVRVKPGVANAQDIAMQLRMVLNQVPLGTIRLDGRDTTVLLDSTVNPSSQNDLDKIFIGTKTEVVPLSSVATVVKTEVPSSVLRKNGTEFVEVAVQADPKKLSTVQAQVLLKTKDLKFPSGVSMLGGAQTQQSSDFADLGRTMLAAIGIVYLIMVLTFRNLRTPFVILCSLPLAVIGAVLGLMISNTAADPTALIGMLMLIGIVVTNAIVLLDKVRQNEEHMTIREAIVEAAGTRVRPILMTAVATICAMLPLLFSKPETGSIVSKSLAVVVIGGLSVATVLTLFIIPCLYELFYFRKSRKQRLAAKREQELRASTATA